MIADICWQMPHRGEVVGVVESPLQQIARVVVSGADESVDDDNEGAITSVGSPPVSAQRLSRVTSFTAESAREFMFDERVLVL